MSKKSSPFQNNNRYIKIIYVPYLKKSTDIFNFYEPAKKCSHLAGQLSLKTNKKDLNSRKVRFFETIPKTKESYRPPQALFNDIYLCGSFERVQNTKKPPMVLILDGNSASKEQSLLFDLFKAFD